MSFRRAATAELALDGVVGLQERLQVVLQVHVAELGCWRPRERSWQTDGEKAARGVTAIVLTAASRSQTPAATARALRVNHGVDRSA